MHSTYSLWARTVCILSCQERIVIYEVHVRDCGGHLVFSVCFLLGAWHVTSKFLPFHSNAGGKASHILKALLGVWVSFP